MSSAPWDFEQARGAARQASSSQRAAEDFIREAYKDFAVKEEAYRVALAMRITELHAEGVAWSSTGDLARGDKLVARLRRDRDIAEGVKEAAAQAGWRASKDRDDVHAFIGWSQRRELAEVGVGG
jgi:hypothetical protein